MAPSKTHSTFSSSTSPPAASSSSSSKPPKSTSSMTTPSPAPTKVKFEPIDATIAAQHKAKGQCIICGLSDHWANACPTRASGSGFRGRGCGRGGSQRTIRVVTKDSTSKDISKDSQTATPVAHVKDVYETTGTTNLTHSQKTALLFQLTKDGY